MALRSSKTQRYPCKHPGCTGHVTYKPERVPAILRNRAAGSALRARTVRVYLTCDNPVEAHEYPYEIPARRLSKAFKEEP